MKEAIKSDAVSRIQYLQAESHVVACEAAVSNAEAALKTARTNLSYCYVKAPCDGVVDVSAYSVGALHSVVLCNRLNWLLFIRITVCIPILILQITNI